MASITAFTFPEATTRVGFIWRSGQQLVSPDTAHSVRNKNTLPDKSGIIQLLQQHLGHIRARDAREP